MEGGGFHFFLLYLYCDLLIDGGADDEGDVMACLRIAPPVSGGSMFNVNPTSDLFSPPVNAPPLGKMVQGSRLC